jgi:glyoxylase-like metal-dependent hydrolase (beta-lactamase superfamily II)
VSASEDVPEYQVYALKYAERPATRGEHFIGGDPHASDAMAMDYFVWAAVGGGRTFVVDTGFGPRDAEERGRTLLRTASEGLALLGIDAATVADVVITHLHYDHVGGFDQFPAARFHVQDREVAFATGRHMASPSTNHAYTARHVADLVLAVHAGRVVFHDGDAVLAPGLELHRVGGHTDGLQVVRVWTHRGWMVLASDASHYYENMGAGRPFPIVYHLGEMLDGYRTMLALADGDDHVVPGHDPLVLDRFPPASEELAGIACRLDRPRSQSMF